MTMTKKTVASLEDVSGKGRHAVQPQVAKRPTRERAPAWTALYAPLTKEQIEAVHAYAAQHGRKWKEKLSIQWYYASAESTLHALRNTHGPAWLAAFRLDGQGRAVGRARIAKGVITNAAISGLPVDFADVARVSSDRRTVTLRHVWPEGTDARAWDAIRRAIDGSAARIAQRTGKSVEIASAHGDTLWIVDPGQGGAS